MGVGAARAVDSAGAAKKRHYAPVSLLASLSFLTVVPSTRNKTLTQREISDSRAYFPLVGLLLGVALVGLERGAREVFPIYLTAALLVVFLIVVTRGLHLDGFMDICDGLFGNHTRERRLEIMKDSHVGAFAVAGAASLLLLKCAAILSLLSLAESGGSSISWSLLLFPMLSRWSMVIAIGAFPYARHHGLGSPYQQGPAKLATLAAVMVAVLASGLLGGVVGLSLLASISILACLLGLAMTRMLGGLTGDAYGAINEVVEVVVLIAAVALLPYGWVEPLPVLF